MGGLALVVSITTQLVVDENSSDLVAGIFRSSVGAARTAARNSFAENWIMLNKNRLGVFMMIGLAALLGGCGMNKTGSSMTEGRPSTPDASMQALRDGNARFVSGDIVANHAQVDRESLAASQAPWAAVLRCADSRVAPEIIFDAEKGDLFVPAVAGNFPTVDLIASIEYAVLELQTNLVVVCGHSSCGAIEAAIAHGEDPDALPGSLPDLVRALQSPCVEGVSLDEEGALNNAVKCAARHSADQVLKMSDVLRKQVAEGKIQVVAAYFDIGTGKVEFFNGS